MTVVIFPVGLGLLVILFIVAALFPTQTNKVMKSAAITCGFWLAVLGIVAVVWGTTVKYAVPVNPEAEALAQMVSEFNRELQQRAR